MQANDKIIDQPTYSMALFRSAIHPEFFQIEERVEIQYNEYDFEAWLCNGGHVLRFEYEGICITEAIFQDIDNLPDRGHVTSMVCAGERDHEQDFGDRITFINSMQIEVLPDHLFGDSYLELSEFAEEANAKVVRYQNGNKQGLSILDVQRYNDQLHVQPYHLQSEQGVVLRTQSIFELKPDATH